MVYSGRDIYTKQEVHVTEHTVHSIHLGNFVLKPNTNTKLILVQVTEVSYVFNQDEIIIYMYLHFVQNVIFYTSQEDLIISNQMKQMTNCVLRK